MPPPSPFTRDVTIGLPPGDLGMRIRIGNAIRAGQTVQRPLVLRSEDPPQRAWLDGEGVGSRHAPPFEIPAAVDTRLTEAAARRAAPSGRK